VTPGKVWLVGAGPGDPELLTLRAARLLGEADAIVFDHLVNPALLEHARPDAERVDAGKECGKHRMEQEQINALLVQRARRGQRVVRLKGGDPFVFGRGGEEAQALTRAGVPWEVVPGISAGVAAAAYAGIPLLHRQHASSAAFVSGHAGRASAGLDCGADTLVVFMCARTIVEIADELIARGRPPETPVALIRDGTLPAQRIWTGTLRALAAREPRSLAAPLLAVIGQVASLARELAWHGEAPRPLHELPRALPARRAPPLAVTARRRSGGQR
jgi:uroporphyrin-III C-methyltransferase